MKYLLTGAAAFVLLTACGKKDKDAADPTPAGVEFSKEKVPSVKVRKGDAGTAAAALDAMSLGTSDAGRVSFDDKSLKGAKAVFKNVTLSAPTPSDAAENALSLNGEEMDFASAGMSAATLEFDGLSMDNGAANFGRMVLSDITVNNDDDESDSSTKIKSIELVNPSPETAAWVASMFGKGEAADMPEGADLAFDRWVMDGLTVDIDEGGDVGQFLIETIEVVGLQEEAAALIQMKNFRVDVTERGDRNTTANIGNIEIRGADFAAFTGKGDDVMGTKGMTQTMMSAVSADPTNPGYDLLRMDNVTANIAGAEIDMKELVSKVGRDNQGRAVKVVTEPFKMTVTSSEGEGGEFLSGQLAALGYEKLVIKGQGDQVYDPDTDLVTLVNGKNYWELEDGFRLDFGAKYAGAAAMAAATNAASNDNMSPDAAIESALESLVFHNFELALDDNGFFDRAFNAYATQAGEDPQELRNQLVGMSAMAPMMAGGMGIDASLATEATTALTSFLQDPKTLTFSFKPAEPLRASDFADMDDPSALTKEKLGFTASNK